MPKTNYPAIQYGARNKRLKRRGITYQQYLDSDHWKQIRKKLRARADFQNCYSCGYDQFIDLHHKSYTKIFSSKLCHHIHSIIPLCRFCHSAVHELVSSKKLGLMQAARRIRKQRRNAS